MRPLAAMAFAAVLLGAPQAGAPLRKAPYPKGLAGGAAAAPVYEFPPLGGTPAPPASINRPAAIGKHRDLPKEAFAKGRWAEAAGARIWRLRLRSPSAAGLRVHFDRFAAGGGRVWLYGGDAKSPQVAGPYTGRGPDSSGAFWSDIVFGDAVTVEYEPASGAPGSGQPPFRIAEITHLFR